MEQLFEAFGLDLRLIAIQIVNFVIVLFALWYFLYDPILRLLKERRQKIEQGLADAEAAKTAREAATEEKQEVLTAAHQEAEAIHTRAEQAAEEERDTIVKNAEDKASEVLANAHHRGEEIKTQARQESDAELAKTAVLAAEKILRERQQ